MDAKAKLSYTMDLVKFAAKAPDIIEQFIDDHSLDTNTGATGDKRRNRFDRLFGKSNEEKLVMAQAIMFSTLAEMMAYDPDLFEEYLVILHDEATNRNS